MIARLTLAVTRGMHAGRVYRFTGQNRIFIGRQADCTIALPDPTISRCHCMIEMESPLVLLRDLDSTNGTRLNGALLSGAAEGGENAVPRERALRDGDRIGLGSLCELRCNIEFLEPGAASDAKETQEAGCDPEAAAVLPDSAGAYADADAFFARMLPEFGAPAADRPPEEKTVLPCANPAELVAQELLRAFTPKSQKSKCICCGSAFLPDAPNARICPACRRDPGKVQNAAVSRYWNGSDLSRKMPEGYSPVHLIDYGGMGEVWKVRQESSGLTFALKTITPVLASDKHAQTLFLREAGIAKLLRHPNVIRTYETGSVNGSFYILMDYCPGGSLESLLQTRGAPLPPAEACHIIFQVLDALRYVHAAGFDGANLPAIVHRDIKPSNLFLLDSSAFPGAVIADFGLAKAFDTSALSHVTRSGTLGGAVRFQPRQQVIRFKYAMPEVDVWAAAACLYYMLAFTHAKNFRDDTDPWTVASTESAVPLRKRNPAVPEPLAQAVDEALVDDPDIGCKSAAQLKENLLRALPKDILRQIGEAR